MMTAEQLKESILQLAMQGKLVEQRSEEGTGEELYKEIQVERKRLIKEGKIKKQKPLPEITEEEIPFEIPESWEWVRVGRVFNLQAGKNKTSSEIGEVQTDILQYPCYGGNGKRGYVKDYNRDGVYALIGRQGALCGNINIASGKFYATEHAVVVEHFCSIDVRWSGYFLRALNLNQYATATAQPGLSVANINRVLIPIPPIAEQKRIVAKIEELMPFVEQYAAASTKLNTLNTTFPDMMKKSILQEAVQGKLVPQDPNDEPASLLLKKIAEEKKRLIKEGKIKKQKPLPEITEDEIPFDIPENWEWARLGEIGETNIGLTYKPSDISENGIIVLRSGNIKNGKMDYADVIKVNCEVPERAMINKGDILICARNGSRKLVGKSAIVDKEGMAFGAFMAKFHSPFLLNEYIQYYIESPLFRGTLDGVGTETINQITQSMLKESLCPVPPLQEQRRIVAELNRVLPNVEALKK